MNSVDQAAAPPKVVRVLLDTRLPQLAHEFEYEIPASLRAKLRFGQRVKVPLRGRSSAQYGWVVGLAQKSSFAGSLSRIDSVVGQVPLLDAQVLKVAERLADRSAGNVCDILRLAVPPRHARAEKKFLSENEQFLQNTGLSTKQITEFNAEETAELSTVLDTRQGGVQETGLGTVQSAAQAENTPAAKPELENAKTQAVVSALLDAKRLFYTPDYGVLRLSSGEWVGKWAQDLASICQQIFAAGRSVIVCVPDWRDLEQLNASLVSLLGQDAAAKAVVQLDAKQSTERRFANFLKTTLQAPSIILGNRSAVYAPAYKLAAVIVWDEADPLLAEPLAPYVHTRDAAIVRAEEAECALLFSGFARSADTQRLIDLGFLFTQEHPPARPKIRHADMRQVPDQFGGRLPEAALRLIRENYERGPVLVQVAAPGESRSAFCASCNTKARCPRCHGPLGIKEKAQGFSCLWCLEKADNWRCAECGSRQKQAASFGSSHTAAQLAQVFQGYRVVLADGLNPLLRVDSRPAIVVATVGAEPIAAGGYSAIVLLDVPRLLLTPTLRVAEDCLRWWENAAAKAGPGAICLVADGAGEVVRSFVQGKTAEYLRAELAERKILRFPPMVRVASLLGEKTTVEKALKQVLELPGVDALPPVITADGLWRATVRTPYKTAGEVAKELRAAVVTAAVGVAKPTKTRPRTKKTAGLRVKFDDRSIFDSQFELPFESQPAAQTIAATK